MYESICGFPRLLILVLASCLTYPATAKIKTPATIVTPIGSDFYPVVLNGTTLPDLQGAHIDQIRAYRVDGTVLEPIPHQIDQRDEQGQFVIAPIPPEARFDANDEFVFMSADAGGRLTMDMKHLMSGSLREVRLQDAHSDLDKWIYVTVSASPDTKTDVNYVRYQEGKDVIESDVYRQGFSSKTPFITNAISLKHAQTGLWSPDLMDTMKLRHRGKLFGMLDFERDQDDYKSKITGVKDGPIRVIRRTENRVRILWYLRTPVITVDYINYRYSFNMDIQINLPFPLGLVFRHVTTLATMDWVPDQALQPTTIYSDQDAEGYVVQGNPGKYQNPHIYEGRHLVVSNAFGSLLAKLDFHHSLPIREQLYLVDDMATPDLPEDLPGQFGNTGFLTSDWEKVGAGRHHMYFTSYLIPDINAKQALELLEQSPGIPQD